MTNSFLKRKFFGHFASATLNLIVVPVLLLLDSVVAGLVVGENAVAGISLVTPAYSLAAFFGGLLSIGVPILYGRAMGEFDKTGASQYFKLGLTASMSAGMILFVSFVLLGNVYLEFFDATPAVLSAAKPYFFWLKLDILIMPLYMFLSEMVFVDGDDAACTISGVAQLLVNIGLSIGLAFALGVEGIGLASFLSSSLGLLIVSTHLLKKSNSLKLGFYFSLRKLLELSKFSTVDSCSYLFLSIYVFTIENFVTYAYGSEKLIVATVILFVLEVQIVFDGVGTAFSPLMNIYLGEGSFEAAKKCDRLAKKTAVIEGVVMSIIVALVAPLIVKMYGIENPETAACAVNGLRIVCLGLAGISFLYETSSYYLLADKIALAFGICGLRDLLVAVPLLFVLGSAFGIYGFFAGIAIAPFVGCILSELFVYFKYGKENYPLLLADRERSSNYRFYELKIEPHSVIETQKKVERYLQENNVEKKAIAKVKLLVEELFMLIYEKNEGKPVYGECTVFVNEADVRLITKDDGVLFDISRDDVVTKSIAEYMVSSYMEQLKNDKMYLKTMSYNRNTFKVDYGI